MFWTGLFIGLMISLLAVIPTLTVVVLWTIINRKINKFIKRFCVSEEDYCR